VYRLRFWEEQVAGGFVSTRTTRSGGLVFFGAFIADKVFAKEPYFGGRTIAALVAGSRLKIGRVSLGNY